MLEDCGFNIHNNTFDLIPEPKSTNMTKQARYMHDKRIFLKEKEELLATIEEQKLDIQELVAENNQLVKEKMDEQFNMKRMARLRR